MTSKMPLRALISVEVLQSSISSAKATAGITYELANATGIWVDPDSNNRVVRDELPLADVRFNLVEKNLSDSYSLPDVAAKGFSKSLAVDTVSFAETFARVVAYKRTFTDAFTLDDLSQIDKDFYGNKGNIFEFTDIIGLHYDKTKTDSYSVTDVVSRTVNFVRNFADVITVYDERVSSLNGTALNTQGLNNKDTGPTIDAELGKENALGFSDITAFQHIKVLSDSQGFTDIHAISSMLGKFDSVSMGDSSYTTISKVLSDAFTLDDSAAVDKDFYGNKGNDFGFTDLMGMAYEKLLTDSYTLGDVNALLVSKASQDSFGMSDEAYSTFSKVITDAFTLDDASTIDKDYYGSKGNIVGLTETFVSATDYIRNLTDGTALGSEELNSNLLGGQGTADTRFIIQDESTVVVDYIREFTDSYSFADDTVYTFVKNINDAFTLDDSALINKDFTGDKGNAFGFSDVLSYDASKEVTDALALVELVGFVLNHPVEDLYTVTDTNVVHPNLGKSETLSFSDTYVRNIMKGLSDAFALDDTAQVNKDVDSTKGNVFGFSDVFSRTVSYDRDYSDSFGFSDTFSRTVSFVRAYSDSYSLDEVRDVHLSKTFADTFTVYDERPNALNVSMLNTQSLNATDMAVTIAEGVDKNDDLAFNETTAFNHDKGLGESLTFSDDYGLQLVKNLSDGFALDDSALVDKDYFGNKGNVVGVTDHIVVDYYYGGLLGQRPLNLVALN